jgi:penicillin-binding protein 2
VSGIWRHAALIVAVLLGACSPVFVTPPPPPPTPTLPAPTATPTPATPEQVAARFFAAWQQSNLGGMYDMLSSVARATTPREVFVRRYTNIRDGIGESRLTVQALGAAQPSSGGMEVPFQVSRSLVLFGDIDENYTLPLVQEQGDWRVAWQPSLIFNGLSASSSVRVVPDNPKRGRILDRADKPLADNGAVLAIGVVPGEIKDEAALLEGLSNVLGMSRETIKQRYQGGQPGWFMPITTRPHDERPDLQTSIGSLPGVSIQDRPARVYPLGPAAAHVIGYVSHPTADELRQLAANGYDESDWVGRAGLEAVFESQLAGQKGGAIQIVDQANRVLRTIAQKASVPGEDLHTSLDAAIQNQAAAALGDKVGSVVVIDPNDNSVLALLSEPSFDPNQFIIGLDDATWHQMNAPDHPLVFRAAESAYPTGSIFKVITMAAGLEQGGFRTTDTFDCGLDWNGLPGVTLHNWDAQGTLSLTRALTASCNPAFYEIGRKLDGIDPTILPGFARRFGLGAATRFGLHESPGTVPDPAWKQREIGQPWTTGDSVNLAIGQGYLLATPLQIANAYSALARGGELLTPALIGSSDTLGDLKLLASTRAAILDGMKAVTSTALGTAYYAFKDEKLSIAAKTGSAENENPDAHAWFVGFAPPDNARLLILVMVEGGQHGGTVAAPVARQIIDFSMPLTRQ